jgi:DNA invertase Pin-like site-specific DNA recombinase
MIYGYARVSTDGQSVEAQVTELTAAGRSSVQRNRLGARSDRAQLKCAVAAFVDGDVLLVTRLDRLARSTHDQLNVLAAVAERGAAFRSLRDALADTTTPHGRLMLTPGQRAWVAARQRSPASRRQDRQPHRSSSLILRCRCLAHNQRSALL